jgi:hypothetical protein
LDKAQRLFEAGEYKKAVQALWKVEAKARTNLAEAEGLLSLADQLREVASGRAQSHAELLVGHAQSHINLITAQPVRRLRGIPCVALGGFGWDLMDGRPYELDFNESVVTIQEPATGVTAVSVGYDELLAFEIGGPGAHSTGGGFMGGGFGVEGAAEGILAATVLNALSTRTKVVTTFSLHAVDGEAFFLHDVLTPHDLRIRLSEIFVRMRQASPKLDEPSSTNRALP